MPPRTPVRTLFTSRFLNKNGDPALLANALGLLSPRKHEINKTPNYKPLIFRHFQKGDVAENYAEIKRELLPEMSMPQFTDHTKQLNFLILDLQAAGTKLPSKARDALDKNMLKHVLALTNEDELIDLLCLSLQQNKLTFPLLTRFLLNKHLTLLHRLPFNIDNLDRSLLRKNGWTQQNFMEFNVVLMKKYNDLKKPILVVKILRLNFEEVFLPLIQLRLLLPFYERIVWRFYFEHYRQLLHPERDEHYYVQSLNNVRSTFSIWESSSRNNDLILRTAMKVHTKLSPLQKAFIQLCTSGPVQEVVSKQLEWNRSKLLAELKKISIRCKVANVGSASASDSVATRAHMYSLINAMDSLIKREFPNWEEIKDLANVMDMLVSVRLEMAQAGPEVENGMILA